MGRVLRPLLPPDARADQRAWPSEEDALAAVALAGCPPGADVLDAPCGYGRHSIPLARAGHRVVGVDRSPVLLAEARRRAGGGDQQVEFLGDFEREPLTPGPGWPRSRWWCR